MLYKVGLLPPDICLYLIQQPPYLGLLNQSLISEPSRLGNDELLLSSWPPSSNRELDFVSLTFWTGLRVVHSV
jgi:hypothetical protein